MIAPSRSLVRVGLGSACLLFGSCAQTSSTDIVIDRRSEGIEPLQVAILPVVNEASGPSWLYYASLPLIYAARLLVFNIDASPPGPDVGAQALRNFVFLSLEYSPSEIKPVPLPLVDDAITEFGPEAYREIAEKTGAEWVVRLTLEDWSSTWYVLETRHDVTAKFELFSPFDDSADDPNEPLLVARVDSDDGAGLSGVPTGLFSLAAAPLAGVDSGPLIDLATQVGIGVGVLVGGLKESGSISEGPAVSDVTIQNDPVGTEFGRLRVECSAPPDTKLSFRIESMPSSTSMRRIDPEAEPVEGLVRYRGSVLGPRYRNLATRRLRINAFGAGTKRNSLVLRVPQRSDTPAPTAPTPASNGN